jgi:regulator of sirC expression with transglutaminase-like and TPR domain
MNPDSLADPAAAALALLRHLGDDESAQPPLAETALAFATLDHTGCDPARYYTHLAEIARQIAEVEPEIEPGGPPMERRVAALRFVLADKFGYRGDTAQYSDLANADMMRVIDRRQGLPVALGILYLHAARSRNWAATGLAFPGHFLIRLDAGAERAIIDPFHGGHALDAGALRALLRAVLGEKAILSPDHYQPVDDREVIMRLQSNVKMRLLQEGRVLEALAVVDRMLLMLPRDATLWRECGLINRHLGRLSAAVESVERAMTCCESDAERHQTALLLQKMKAAMN